VFDALLWPACHPEHSEGSRLLASFFAFGSE